MSAAPASPGRAQSSTLEPLGNRLVERLTDGVPTSGLLLAGVHWGRAAGNAGTETFRKENLGLQLSQGLEGRKVCVRVTTRDGRYRGMASYTVLAGTPARATLGFPSGYLPVLQQMPVADFAVRAIVTDDCGDASKGTIIPAVVSPRPSSGILTVYLNPGDATARARLVAPDGRTLSGEAVRCQSVGPGTKIAYSHVCELTISEPGYSGRASLEVMLVELTDGISRSKFDIEIPAR